jgi:crotonobetainyl-CoA:carnitine CoA-transferase CaiB-like acyl-CoA transferase
MNLPFRMSGAKVAAGKRVSTLGEHTRALLKETGFTQEQITALLGRPLVAERS